MTKRIYLDWNATAPTSDAATAAMTEVSRVWANPSSIHAEGRRAKGLLETCREQIAGHLNAEPAQLVFTSGGTEALALALHGTAAKRVHVLATEHSAVLSAAPDASVVPVDANGLVDLAALGERLEAGDLVAVQHANSETGVIQPIEAVLELAWSKGAHVLSDCVQSAGKLPIPKADLVAVSAHKLGGPPGVGALIVLCADGFSAMQKGGGQERGLRGGTENLPGIAGFAAALDARLEDSGWTARVEALRDRLEARLGTEIAGAGAARLPTTSMLRMKGVAAATQLIQFDLAGFAVSSGSACSSGKVGKSHVLEAMRLEGADEYVRVSLGWSTTVEEVDAFAEAWLALASRKRAA